MAKDAAMPQNGHTLPSEQGATSRDQPYFTEDELRANLPEVLEMLLKDHTTQRHIFWATNNYAELGEGYLFNDLIEADAITGNNSGIIMRRFIKSRQQQQQRSREMAEVFTPSWICNKQNNLIDDAWFGRENVFNTEIDGSDGTHDWVPSEGKIQFPSDKSWQDYVTDVRLEITCGEAPYLVNTYDAVTGLKIPIEKRVGLLDRKLRVVKENTHTEGQWLAAVKAAVRSIYGYEWQGDNLLFARENILYAVCDHYQDTFHSPMPKNSLLGFAYIISWNLWQMDGLKGVIPDSCGETRTVSYDLFGETTTVSPCRGCKDGDITKHNGTYALIVEWPKCVTSSRVQHKAPFRFIDLLK